MSKQPGQEDLEMIELIIRCRDKWYARYMHKNYFKQKKANFVNLSYGIWGMEELLDYVLKERPYDILSGIEDFRKRMDEYACNAKTDSAQIVFICAHDAATLVLDELIMNGYEYGYLNAMEKED